MPANHWTLFVDESGDFDRGEPHALAAGLLVERRWTPALERQLGERLVEATPGLLSPAHAWTLKSPEKLREAISKGKVELSAETARELRNEDDGAVSARLAEYRAGVARAVRGLPELAGARVAVVGAASDPTGARRKARYGQVRGDAYVEALAALLARVVLLVREPGNDVVVGAHVATRNVTHDDLGRPTDLSPALLAQVANAVTARLPGGASVHFTAERVEAYDGKRGGVVLADTVANAYFAAARDRALSDYASVTRVAWAQWGLPAALSTPATRGAAMPTFAAAGAAHEALVAAANGAQTLAHDEGGRGWAREQALAWVGVLT